MKIQRATSRTDLKMVAHVGGTSPISGLIVQVDRMRKHCGVFGELFGSLDR